MPEYYYMIQSRGAPLHCNTVVADGTPSPEMGPVSQAYRFESRLSAARVAAKLAFPVIHELPGVPQ
jgi:hypothetical protein